MPAFLNPLHHVPLNRALLLVVAGLLNLSCLEPLQAQAYDWQNHAGLPGGPGNVDGVGTAAKLYYPDGLARDSQGNLYVLESQNRLVRKITPDGVVTTLAGSSRITGHVDGLGSAASFQWPRGIACDSQSNVYVTDANTLRKITPAGFVTTFAGKAGYTGSSDGNGGAARFNSPSDVVIDAANNLYIADMLNSTIRKISPSGQVTTLAGKANAYGHTNGQGAAARFWAPEKLAIDALGNLYVVEWGFDLRKVTPAGLVTTYTPPNGVFSSDMDTLAFDADNNLYCTGWSSEIKKITPEGVVSNFAGAFSGGYLDGPANTARFEQPSALLIDPQQNMYVADSWNHAIRKITPAGQVSTFAGSPGYRGKTDDVGSNARFWSLSEIICDKDGNIFTTENYNGKLRKTTPSGAVSLLQGGWALAETSADNYTFTHAMTVDSHGNLYDINGGFKDDTLRRIATDGTVTLRITSDGSGNKFDNASGVAVDLSGNIYVADSWNYQICKITPSGTVTTLAGKFNSSGSADGKGSAARFDFPEGLAVDSHGNVFVAEYFNDTIRKITPAGQVSTFAGKANQTGHLDGLGQAARLTSPSELCIDSTDNLYFIDSSNSTIRKITPAGKVITIGGTPGVHSAADGPGPLAQFCRPAGIAVAPDGTVYVSDTANNRIMRGRPIQCSMTLMGGPVAITAGDKTPSLTDLTDFGAAKPLGGLAVTHTFTISSHGADALTLTGTPRIDIRGLHAADFTVALPPDQRIETGSSTTFSIAFSPSAKGLRKAEIYIPSTDTQHDPFTFAIQGTGDSDAPGLKLLTPVLGTASTTVPLMVTGAATDNFGIDRVEAVLNSETAVLAQIAPSQIPTNRSFSASVVPQEGSNSLTVTAYDKAGNSSSVTRAFTFLRRWRLSLVREVPAMLASMPDKAGTLSLKVDPKRATPLGSGNPQFSAVLPDTLVQVNASPKAGHLFSHWTDLPSGAVILGNTVSFQMPNADVPGPTAIFITNPFTLPALANPFPATGTIQTFAGLVQPVPPTPLGNETVGLLSAVLTRSSGSLTGKLFMDGQMISFVAVMHGDGSVWFHNGTALAEAVIFGDRTLRLSWSNTGLGIEVAGPDQAMSTGLAQPAKTAPASLLDVQGRPAYYTLALSAKPQMPAKLFSSYPQGTGFGTFTLAAAGTMPITGILADGTKFTINTTLVSGDTCPLYIPLLTPGGQTNGGSLMGTLVFDASQQDTDVRATDLQWFRPVVTESTNTATRIYTSGWPEGIVLDAFGARYNKTLTIEQCLGLTSPHAISGNAKLTLEGGRLPALLSFTPFNIAANLALKIPVTDKSYTLTFTQSTGLMKGSFTSTWTSPAIIQPSFQGVLLQKGSRRGGYGNFHSNRLNDLDPESGSVILGRP